MREHKEQRHSCRWGDVLSRGQECPLSLRARWFAPSPVRESGPSRLFSTEKAEANILPRGTPVHRTATRDGSSAQGTVRTTFRRPSWVRIERSRSKWLADFPRK